LRGPRRARFGSAADADRGLFTVEQLAGRLAERSVDLAQRHQSYNRGERFERFSQLLGLRQSGRGGRGPLGLQPLNERRQPLKPRYSGLSGTVASPGGRNTLPGGGNIVTLSRRPEWHVITACFVGYQSVLESLDALHK
jgi:hypothetical protein